ncbi:MAG: ATP-dependent protease subunit HslV [Planctomycetota bacterium]
MTTVLAVSHNGTVAVGGDGQVTVANYAVKHKAVKVRRLHEDRVLVGFAGAAADALALLECFEGKLKDFQGNIARAATELAKVWRTDRVLRHLDSQLVASDGKVLLLVTGSGEVLSPDDGVLGIGSGGPYAAAAARALVRYAPSLDAAAVVRAALEIAADICIYTNREITVEVVS